MVSNPPAVSNIEAGEKGFDIDEAVEFANLAAGVVVGKIGSATATLNEIIEYESSLNKSSSDKHIKTQVEIAALSEELKSKRKRKLLLVKCALMFLETIGLNLKLRI